MDDRNHRFQITLHSIIGTSAFAILLELIGNDILDDASTLIVPLLTWSMVMSGLYVMVRLNYTEADALLLGDKIVFLTVWPAVVGGGLLLWAIQPAASVAFQAGLFGMAFYAYRNQIYVQRQRAAQAEQAAGDSTDSANSADHGSMSS